MFQQIMLTRGGELLICFFVKCFGGFFLEDSRNIFFSILLTLKISSQWQTSHEHAASAGLLKAQHSTLKTSGARSPRGQNVLLALLHSPPKGREVVLFIKGLLRRRQLLTPRSNGMLRRKAMLQWRADGVHRRGNRSLQILRVPPFETRTHLLPVGYLGYLAGMVATAS